MNRLLQLPLQLAGLLLLLCSPLQSQTVSLDSFQEVQLLNIHNCAVVQVNASWNYKNRVKIEKVSNLCHVAEIDIENKTIGATIAKEWDISIVPTIIVLKNGKEVKRFEPDLSMKFNEDVIIESIRKEIK